jgi:hypothetical protein
MDAAAIELKRARASGASAAALGVPSAAPPMELAAVVAASALAGTLASSAGPRVAAPAAAVAAGAWAGCWASASNLRRPMAPRRPHASPPAAGRLDGVARRRHPKEPCQQ